MSVPPSSTARAFRVRFPGMTLTIPDFSQTYVVVAGDVMLDQYLFGATSRISPEAPVPVDIVWVVPPEPLPWRCLSVVLDDAPETGAVGLAGVAVYGDLDFGGGLTQYTFNDERDLRGWEWRHLMTRLDLSRRTLDGHGPVFHGHLDAVQDGNRFLADT